MGKVIDMCQQCYIEAGKPNIINEDVLSAVESVKKLYQHPDCGVGGYAHIATDDWNLENEDIDWCIDEAEKHDCNWIDEEGRLLSLDALRKLKCLSVEERYTVLALYGGYINE